MRIIYFSSGHRIFFYLQTNIWFCKLLRINEDFLWILFLKNFVYIFWDIQLTKMVTYKTKDFLKDMYYRIYIWYFFYDKISFLILMKNNFYLKSHFSNWTDTSFVKAISFSYLSILLLLKTVCCKFNILQNFVLY